MEHGKPKKDADGNVVTAADPAYFQSRPSAAGTGYDPLATSASNLGPENKDLVAAYRERRAAAARLDGVAPAPRRPRRAAGQRVRPRPGHQPRVRRRAGGPRGPGARPEPGHVVRALVARHTQGRMLGFLGEPAVNVLELNLALDAASR